MKGIDQTHEMLRRLVHDATTAMVYAAMLDGMQDDGDLWASFEGTVQGHALPYLR